MIDPTTTLVSASPCSLRHVVRRKARPDTYRSTVCDRFPVRGESSRAGSARVPGPSRCSSRNRQFRYRLTKPLSKEHRQPSKLTALIQGHRSSRRRRGSPWERKTAESRFETGCVSGELVSSKEKRAKGRRGGINRRELSGVAQDMRNVLRSEGKDPRGHPSTIPARTSISHSSPVLKINSSKRPSCHASF